jgi:hypothetical protein
LAKFRQARSLERGPSAPSIQAICFQNFVSKKNYRAEERRVLAESIESAKINVSVFKGFYKYTTIKCNLEGRVNLPRCRESEFGEYLYFTFFFVAITF